MNAPRELVYTKSHEWVRTVSETTVVVGLTGYAQDALGDLVFVNLPEPGDDVTAGEAFGDVESVKAVLNVLSPITGQVEEINEELLDSPESVDQSPYDAWFVEIKDVSGKEELMGGGTRKAYLEALQTSWKGGGPMGSYVPNTSGDRREVLRGTGFDSFKALLSHIPQGVHVKGGLELPGGPGEMEIIGKMKETTQQNVVLKHISRGAGAYSHYIPVIVKSMVSKKESPTSYIPYQAEISQGTLQSAFKYQTMLCKFTGMDVSNISVYDGITAAAETAIMYRDRKRSRVYLSVITHPQVIEVVKTYCFGSRAQVVMVPEKDGVTDADTLRELSDDTASCLYMQQPNYCGNLERCGLLGEIIHEKGARYIMSYNPTSLALLSTPAECGADIVVGGGQPLGVSLCFGSLYLDFMTVTSAMGRELLGRIAREIRGMDGKRAHVLVLQAREQHIGREKTNSSVCSNQVLCALTASVYVATIGGEGLRKIAVFYTSKAHYLKEQLEQAGPMTRYDREFFHELVIEGDTDSGLISKAPGEKGTLGGLLLNDREILRHAAEQNRKENIDQAA